MILSSPLRSIIREIGSPNPLPDGSLFAETQKNLPLSANKIMSSKSDARRAIKSNALKINNEILTEKSNTKANTPPNKITNLLHWLNYDYENII